MHEPWQSALRLQLTPGLGLRRARTLVQHLGGCDPALEAPDALLRDALGTDLWSSLRTTPAEWDDALVRVRPPLSRARAVSLPVCSGSLRSSVTTL